MRVVLDAGALIAFEQRDERVIALLLAAQRRGWAVRTSAAVVAQVWRHGSRQALLARGLRGVDQLALDASVSRQVGDLLGTSRTHDVVDAHLALLVSNDDVVCTSDPGDLRRLLRQRKVAAEIVQV